VRQRLAHYDIPFPKIGIRLGEISLHPFEGGENIAQYFAYAASVERQSSTVEAIKHIGEQLGATTKQKSTIRLISAPLLGSGAGKLDPRDVVNALSSGFKALAHEEATLVLHVPDGTIFQMLSTSSGVREHEPEDQSPMRVFISYSHTSETHKSWVQSLGTFLRECGIDARLDVWHLRYGMDLPQFMANELTMAAKVILVSDEKYAEKADGRVGGVGWETMIVQGDMYRLPPDSTKYLVIVRSEDVDKGLPAYLKTKFVLHWNSQTSDEEKRESLLRELYNVIKIPPLGKKPVFV
jgi:hypothetical protein